MRSVLHRVKSSLFVLSLLVGCHRDPQQAKVVVEPAHASAPAAALRPRVIERRYIAPPGVPAHVWDKYAPIIGPDQTRLALSPAEAAAIEERFISWLRQRTHDETFDTSWGEQVMLFEKMHGPTGDKVAISGFDRGIFDGTPRTVTVDMLRDLDIDDGGCSVWRVFYDVRTKTFESFACNGSA